jgi:hypothetical protein
MKITALKKIYNPKEPIFLDYSFESPQGITKRR